MRKILERGVYGFGDPRGCLFDWAHFKQIKLQFN